MSNRTNRDRSGKAFTAPPTLNGRRARDPFWMAVSAAFAGVQFVRGLRPPAIPEPRPVSHDLPLVVRSVTSEAEGVVSLTLAAPNGAVLPAWQPGSHLDIKLPSGRRRQYSLCGDPSDRRTYRIATRLIPDGDGGSAEVHTLEPGNVVITQGPRNAFPFLRHERYLFLAGGIGITPVLPMAREAERRGADWKLIYTGRNRETLPFLAELAELPADRVMVRTDDADGLPDAAEWLSGVTDTAIYCCGPTPMLEALRNVFRRSHGTLHYERFAPAPIVDGRPFTLHLERSGLTLDVPADRSALSVVKEALPGVGYSCQQGFCGTCRVKVVAGEVERRGGDLLDGSMLICVSRAQADSLTIDL